MLSVPETTQKIWEAWNVRGYIIASLLVQTLLILLAPLRKRRWGTWGKSLDILLWSAYLFADWVAIGTLGFILSNQMQNSGSSSNNNDHHIEVLWAPFLLLHLGGPDTITSFALEDNELWVRHLLGLPLQVGSTIYVFIASLPNNNLWLPTFLVLVAGIIKYAERNRAFYMASSDHLGETWVSSEWGDEIPIPPQFQRVDNDLGNKIGEPHFRKSILWSAVHHFGSIKRILVGPLLSLNQHSDIRETFRQLEKPDHVLKIMEIELSLLYEVLHTKFPVIDCGKGYAFRAISLLCIIGALLSFSFLKGQYGELGVFDVVFTFGLLIGAVSLDVISVLLIFLSDWFFIAHWMWRQWPHQGMEPIFIEWPRWSKKVSQIDFIKYHMRDSPSLLKSIANVLHLGSWLEAIRGFRCLSCESFTSKVWEFIFYEVRETNEYLISKMKDMSKTVLEPKEVWRYSCKLVLKNFNKSAEQITTITKHLSYSKCIVTWHIATELCFQEEANSRPTDKENTEHRAHSKLLSDYMFYLALMQPAMMAAVSTNWKAVFEDTLKQTEDFAPRASVSNKQDAIKKILRHDQSSDGIEPDEDVKNSVLCVASKLAKQLKGSGNEPVPWKAITKVWVQLMCFAAINCKPTIHAQQPSKGGELLTFVWLYMNHMGLGIHFSTQSFS